MATVIVLAVLVTAVALAIIKLIKNKKNGKCTCCPYSGTCSNHSCCE